MRERRALSQISLVTVVGTPSCRFDETFNLQRYPTTCWGRYVATFIGLRCVGEVNNAVLQLRVMIYR